VSMSTVAAGTANSPTEPSGSVLEVAEPGTPIREPRSGFEASGQRARAESRRASGDGFAPTAAYSCAA
jgi:hypothetical protein